MDKRYWLLREIKDNAALGDLSAVIPFDQQRAVASSIPNGWRFVKVAGTENEYTASRFLNLPVQGLLMQVVEELFPLQFVTWRKDKQSIGPYLSGSLATVGPEDEPPLGVLLDDILSKGLLGSVHVVSPKAPMFGDDLDGTGAAGLDEPGPLLREVRSTLSTACGSLLGVSVPSIQAPFAPTAPRELCESVARTEFPYPHFTNPALLKRSLPSASILYLVLELLRCMVAPIGDAFRAVGAKRLTPVVIGEAFLAQERSPSTSDVALLVQQIIEPTWEGNMAASTQYEMFLSVGFLLGGAICPAARNTVSVFAHALKPALVRLIFGIWGGDAVLGGPEVTAEMEYLEKGINAGALGDHQVSRGDLATVLSSVLGVEETLDGAVDRDGLGELPTVRQLLERERPKQYSHIKEFRDRCDMLHVEALGGVAAWLYGDDLLAEELMALVRGTSKGMMLAPASVLRGRDSVEWLEEICRLPRETEKY